MAKTAAKVKAIILILLLVGSEGARIEEMSSIARAQRLGTAEKKNVRDLPADKEWKKVNEERCSWNAFGCTGAGCRFRPLPLDKGPKESCRLSNAKMLESTSSMEYFSDLQATILSEKAARFKARCSKQVTGIGWFKIRTMVCLRRASHMMQASQFIMKQQREMLKADKAVITQGEAAKQEKSVAKAMEALTSVLGEDGHYVMKFRAKLMSDPIQLLKNPKESARMMADVMSGLTSDDSSRKQGAQDIVNGMPDGKPELLTKDAADEVKAAIEENPLDVVVAEVEERQTWHEIEVAFVDEGRDVSKSGEAVGTSVKADVSSGLLQVNDASTFGRRRKSKDKEQKGYSFAKKKKFNLQKLISIILWILLITSMIAVFLAVVGLWGAELPASLAWAARYSGLMVRQTGWEAMNILKVAGGIFWYSGIVMAMRWIWRKVLSGPDQGPLGWKSKGITNITNMSNEGRLVKMDYREVDHADEAHPDAMNATEDADYTTAASRAHVRELEKEVKQIRATYDKRIEELETKLEEATLAAHAAKVKATEEEDDTSEDEGSAHSLGATEDADDASEDEDVDDANTDEGSP